MQKLFVFLLAAVSFVLVSCASSEQTKSADSNVSTIPWNRPQQWEGQGMIGGMMNQ